ncbi:MAG: hypothetical protein QHG94_06860 [Candidatus Methanosuratincola sp.]|nr:hypothetical protein [Candidatus Methanosuratincola sp.]
MSTIWDLLSRRLMQGYAGAGGSTLRACFTVTGVWASSRTLKAVLGSLRSLLWSFSKVQEAVRVAITGVAVITRVSASHAGAAIWSRPKGRSVPRSGATAPRKGGIPSPKRGRAPLTVVLSLSAAGSVAKAAAAYSSAISSSMPPAFAPCQNATGGATQAVEGIRAEPEVEESRGVRTPDPPAGTVIGGAPAPAATRDRSQKETGKGVGRRVAQTPSYSGLALSSSFLATAALLGTRATAAFSGAAGSAFHGRTPRALPLGWKAAGAAPAATPEQTIATLPSAGKQPPTRMKLPELQPLRDGMGSTGGVAEGAAISGTGIKVSEAAEMAEKQLPRSPKPTGTAEAVGEWRAPPEAAGIALARASEAGGASLGDGSERLAHPQGEAGSGEAAFLPLAAAIESAEFRRAACVLKPIFGAVSPALFALSVPTIALMLPGRKSVPAPSAQAFPIRQAAAEQAAAPGAPSARPLQGSGLPGTLKAAVPLSVPNLAALAEEVRSSIVAPQLAIPAGIGSRSGIDEDYERTAENLPVPMELEEPQVYPMQREVRVNVAVEGGEDLLELQRKISRILEDEMRRHYGEG